MIEYTITKPEHPINHTLTIGGSKSLSNRVLIIKHLCSQDFDITNLSESDDTEVLLKSLDNIDQHHFDLNHAGTSFRFLTALFATNKSSQILTGSDRMKERPIGDLVDALISIGADISYLEKQGYPPIKIGEFTFQKTEKVSIRSNVSSQFLSALCLVAPSLPLGLTIQYEESKLVSGSYLNMTLDLMRYFGIEVKISSNQISIRPQKYKPKDIIIESDWSSASYLYGLVSLIKDSRLRLNYYFKDSLQGDSALSTIMENFGVQTEYHENGIEISHVNNWVDSYQYDFIDQPDLFQTICILAAAKNILLDAKELSTLHIKETDRITALETELRKVNISLNKMKSGDWEYRLNGSLMIDEPQFNTYNDHRMAMALSMLSCLSTIVIRDPLVVSKSYSRFWDDLQSLGFQIKKRNSL